MWLLAIATRLAINWESLTHGSGRRRFDGAVSLAAPRVLSMTTPGAASVMGVVRWTTLSFWRATHPNAGWVVTTGITWKTQRSIESLDVEIKAGMWKIIAMFVQVNANSSGVFNVGWRCPTIDFLTPDAILSLGYVTSHTRRGWEIIHVTSQVRNTRHTDTQLIECFELLLFSILCVCLFKCW